MKVRHSVSSELCVCSAYLSKNCITVGRCFRIFISFAFVTYSS